MNKAFNWKIFFILWIAAVFGVIAILPYSLALQSGTLQNMALPIPLPALIAIQIAQNALIFGALTAAGLFFASRIGLGTPILEAKLIGEPIADKVRSILPISVGLGVVAALIIIGLDVFVFQAAMLKELGENLNDIAQTAQPAAWKGFFASFYGGIVEEILLRLFLMSLLAWIGSFVSTTAEGRPTVTVFWIANILAAIIFGLGHLPATATIMPLTPLIITRAIVLNGVAGIFFGYLYWKRGLESAMVSHFSADIVLHVLFAL